MVGMYTPLTLFNKKSILDAFVASIIFGESMEIAMGASDLNWLSLFPDTMTGSSVCEMLSLC
jgi:hypothetical protein